MANRLDMAEQQLLGWYEGVSGTPLIDLVTSMGMTRSEWIKIKNNYEPSYLKEESIREIDEHFNL